MSIEKIERLIEGLTKPHTQMHRSGHRVEKSPPSIQREAAATIRVLVDELSRLREVERRAEEVLTPFAMTANQMDRDMPGARNQKVTFEHPSKIGADEECDQWPLPDNFMVLHAWRYHDPRPISEAMGFQMVHLRAALELYRALSEREGQA